uniref:GG12537 n=1 Tax=Drosophila erecta TaxID=7220 RepID=B3P7M7_DROER
MMGSRVVEDTKRFPRQAGGKGFRPAENHEANIMSQLRFTNPQEQNEREPQMEPQMEMAMAMESEEPDLLQLEKIAIAITKAEKDCTSRPQQRNQRNRGRRIIPIIIRTVIIIIVIAIVIKGIIISSIIINQ